MQVFLIGQPIDDIRVLPLDLAIVKEADGLAPARYRWGTNPMSGLTQPVILVIDANSQHLASALAILNQRNYRCLGTGETDQAMTLTRDNELDLIICDQQFQGELSLELVDSLRALPNRQDVPVMFTSATQLPDVISRRYHNSPSFCLRKPIDPVLLIELVEKSLWMPHLVKSHIHRPHIHFGAPSISASMPAVGQH